MSIRNFRFQNFSVLALLILFYTGCKEETTAPTNHDPIITSIVAFPSKVSSLDSFAVVCSAYEVDGDQLFYDWSCTSGAKIKGGEPSNYFSLSNTTENIGIFYAPDSAHTIQDTIRIDVNVRDGKGGGKSGHLFVALSK